jgi:hypothetical protein
MTFDVNTGLLITLAAVQAYSNYRDYVLNRKKDNNNESGVITSLKNELNLLKQRFDLHDRQTRDKSIDDKELEKYVLEHERRLGIFERDIQEFKEDMKEFKDIQNEIFNKIESTNRLIVHLSSGIKNDRTNN